MPALKIEFFPTAEAARSNDYSECIGIDSDFGDVDISAMDTSMVMLRYIEPCITRLQYLIKREKDKKAENG